MSSHIENDTNQLILDTAVSLLNTHGNTFTVDQLAAHTQLSRATIYRRVGNKESLLQRLAAERNMDIEALSQPDIHERILAAASTVFGRYGLLRPTMEQIAEEAGVGIATLYRHFGDRASLLEAFAEHITPNLVLQREMLDPTADFEQILYRLAETVIAFTYEYRDMFRHTIGSYDDDITVFKQVRAFQEQNIYMLAQFLQAQMDAGYLKPADPQELSFAMIGMTFAFTVMRPTFNDVHITNPGETAKFIVDLFLSGGKATQ